MSAKNESKVLIGGNVYTLSGDESEEYLQQVALYMNKKMDEVRFSDNGKRLNTRMQSVLLAINIADDYFKMKSAVQEEKKESTLLKEQIETLKKQMTSIEDGTDVYKEKITELEKQIEYYKKELDDYILLFEQSE